MTEPERIYGIARNACCEVHSASQAPKLAELRGAWISGWRRYFCFYNQSLKNRMEVAEAEVMWKPTTPKSNAVDDDALGTYLPHGGTWSSIWDDEQNSIEVTGYGDRPTKTQKETWVRLLPVLDGVIRAAGESIPPPPKPTNKWFSWFSWFSHTDPVPIDQKLQLEILDDGTHTILFPSACIIDGESFSPLVEMRGIEIILSEWSN